jgi:HAD superfamily hydrolase (TIGR01509 family)
LTSAIIFDLDGVIIESEEVHYQAHKNVLQAHGIDLSLQEYKQHGMAKGSKHFYTQMKEKYGINADIPTLQELKKQHYLHLITQFLHAKEHVEDFINRMHKKHKLGIGSASNTDVIETVLHSLGIHHFFEVIVGGDQVKKNKPAPDVYLLVAKKMEVLPEQCLVIEDSQTGVIAARHAGMKCVAVPTEFTIEQDFSMATKVVDHLKQISEDDVTDLLILP